MFVIFPYIHNDDIGEEPIGDIIGIPIKPWYPESAQKREVELIRTIIRGRND